MFEVMGEDWVGVVDTRGAGLSDPLDLEATRVPGMVERAQSRFDGLLADGAADSA